MTNCQNGLAGKQFFCKAQKEAKAMKRVVRLGASPLEKDRLPESISREEQKKIWAEIQEIRSELKNADAGSVRHSELVRRYDHLRNVVVESNLVYVKSMVSKYQRRISYSLEVEDLNQEGRIALLEAFDRFQPSRGVTFLTYATNWIKKYILLAIENQSLVRMPSHMHKVVRKTNRALKQIIPKKEGGRVSVADVAKAMGISVKRLEHVRQRAVRGFLSFDSPTSEKDDRPLAEKLPSSQPAIDDLLAFESLNQVINHALTFLDERQTFLVGAWFGLVNDENPRLLKDIGEELGTDRHGALRIRDSALTDLRDVLTNKIFVGGEREIRMCLE
jgi:RNA polymerase primary sigma factor